MLRRRLRLSAAAGASLLIAASGVVSAAGVAQAERAGAAAEDPVVDVTIDSFTPAAPKPGDQVVLTGRITNTSTATFDNSQAAACIDDKRLSTRAQLAAIATEADEPIAKRNDCVGLNNSDSTSFQEFAQPLAPKASVPFRLVIPWKDWGITGRSGVYTVGVRFRGNTSPSDRVSAGLSRTLMPVVPARPMPRKVNTALVVPLRHRPTLLGGDRFANESLADSMAPNGQLGRLLALGQKQRVTWLVDPAMLEEARTMREGYRITGPDNQTKPGTKSPTVAAWLRAFDANRASNPVVLLPYGDPEVASLLDSGEPLRDLVGQARSATEQFNLGDAHGFRSGLWLENGAATSKNLAAASTGYAGAKADDINLVTSSAWSAGARPDLAKSPVYDVLTPEGPVKSVRTVIADSSLTAGGPDPGTATSPIQVQQRFAAETALLASTGTGDVTVVAVPPRGWDDDGRSTTSLARDLALPWIRPVTIDQAAAAPGAKPALAKAPDTPRSTPGLTNNQLDQIKQLGNAVTTYVSLLADPEQADENLRRSLLRSASSGWRGFPDESQRFATVELTSVNGQVGRVHLVTNPAGERGGHREIKVNLSGSKGTFPLTVANELNESVRVGIVVTSANRSDLRIDPLQTKLIPAGQKATYQINASAEQNGLIRANAQVISAQQLPVGRSQELVIQAAQYGSVGWILVGSAVALLFGTSLVRIYRRIRSERRNPTPEAGTDPLHPAPIDPQDLTADTGTGSGEEQTAGEPNPLDPVTPGRIGPDRAGGAPAGQDADAGTDAESGGKPSDSPQQSLKEGVGTKDG
ncbi:hypothetical protein [Kribbella amoyensis]|uniref:hypothetical protein n=1 Tax=Kribbella amoyensis TaxID=996641 RepID=UPI00192DAF5B|nr:hypothetical protein [Kribbella amoyensis]